MVVWFGELPVPARANETVGPVPADVDRLLGGGGVVRPTETVIDGGRRVLWPTVTADGPVVVAVDVSSSEMNKDVLAKWAWLGLVGVAIVLAAGVVAGRFGRFITPPSMPTGEPQPVG